MLKVIIIAPNNATSGPTGPFLMVGNAIPHGRHRRPQRGAQSVTGAIMGKRAELFKFYLRDFRDQRVKKQDALAVISNSDGFPGWARTKARRMLARIERKSEAPF